jgi:hypothetical protein
MTNVLLILAVLGMAVGVYAMAMPTLTRKGWRLPFASFFGDADDGEDVEFSTPFEMPRAGETSMALASAIAAPVEEAEPLPPVVSIDLAEEEDDPTLTPLFEGLDAELTAEPAATEASPAEAAGPNMVLVPGQPANAAPAPDAIVTQPIAEEPQPEAVAAGGDDMLSLFAEASDAGKEPSKIYEAVGNVSITDLQEEVRQLREILNKRAA